LAFSLNQLVGAMHFVQIMCFWSMMNIQYPANVQAFLNLNMDVLNVDVLEFTNEVIFDFEYDEELVEVIDKEGKDSILFE
jgi:hypothetical protein